MTEKPDIREVVCKAIRTSLERSGRKLPQFKDTDIPIKDYTGFDSQCGIEVTVELEVILGIDNLGNNVFVKGEGKAVRARTLLEIVKSVSARSNR